MKLTTSARKKFRVGNKVKKVAKPERFRLSISRSSKNISAQIIDDKNNKTLVSASSIEKDLKDNSGRKNLNSSEDFDQIAKYVGSLNLKHSSPKGMNTDTVLLGSTFIVGGQIKGQPMELFLIYPQGNYIKPADSKPYLVIGEVKYGKPILDRVITPDVKLGDASRCALISMDSTLKSDLTVGPPIDFVVYKKDQFKIASQKCLNLNDEEFSKMTNEWSEGILKVFKSFPRFDWE